MTIHERIIRIPSTATPEYIDVELERALLYRFPGAEVTRCEHENTDNPRSEGVDETDKPV